MKQKAPHRWVPSHPRLVVGIAPHVLNWNVRRLRFEMHFERRKSRSWTSRKCNNRVVSECRFRPEAQPKTENNRSDSHEDHLDHLKLLI